MPWFNWMQLVIILAIAAMGFVLPNRIIKEQDVPEE